jgi:hypothetical protein
MLALGLRLCAGAVVEMIYAAGEVFQGPLGAFTIGVAGQMALENLAHRIPLQPDTSVPGQITRQHENEPAPRSRMSKRTASRDHADVDGAGRAQTMDPLEGSFNDA